MATSSPANNAHLLSALLLLLLLSDVDHTVSTPSPHTQATILLTLKKSLTSPSTIHSKLNGWDPSIHHCTWPGLSCDSSTSLVTSLDLSNSNISGFIPACLFSLTSLRHLSLSSNSLSGHLPSSLATLPSLLHLNLSSNHFNGSLSSSFSHTLQILDLYDNDFSGPLPPSLPSLPQLRHLDLGGNYFSGIIPLTYGDFPRLEYLSLAGNDLAGAIPAVLGNVTTLKQLFLGYYNDFDGGIPPELGKLANLAHLDLSSCGLEGVIPPELGYLSNLDTLFVQTNQLTGTIPPTLGNLTLLRSLDLSNNALAGSIPVELSKLRNLQLLYLFINKFHGDIPAFVSELPHLELLELWQNNLTGPIPPGLGKEARLRVVDLSSNRLTGSIPSTLCHGRRLEILILQNNFLFGPLPSDFGNCRTLTRVRLGQNYLTGAVPRSFLYLPDLQLVELQNNYLTGTLAEFSTPEPKQQPLRKLAQINLSNNRLFGWIPSSIGNIDNLQILLLDGNQFTGEIPRMLGKLKRVLKIDLGRNNLTGSIPVEISGCTLLSYLDVSKNKLSGPLPPEISQIHILNYLNVSWNRLNGSIPKELGAIKSLTSVDFTHNDFGGQIPNNGQFAYFNSTSFRFNPHLCGSSPSPSSSYCNGSTTYVLPSQSDQERERRKTGGLPGKFKLLLALVLLACSLVFAVTVAIKTRSMIHGGGKRRIKRWKMTAFQKVQFKAEDVVDCMKDANIIGRGGAGVVYRGCAPLGSGETVAVKRLLGIGHGGGDGGFNAEIQTLGNIRHRNIVRLLAFCSNGETKLLVYEYMPNGSLGEVLHGKSGGYLRWELRLKIAMEAARGLCYLHHDCCPPILHRDVKSNNILLNGDWEAHVSDFGLAKFLRGVDSGMSECMSAIAGSYGYIAPEYAYTLKVDEKSDVYSFGVVLLELITGRKPVGDFGEEGLDIVQWAKMSTNLRRESVVVILDKRLSEVPMEEAMQVFFVSMLCVKEQSIERPTMREVVQMLGEAKQTNLAPFHGR